MKSRSLGADAKRRRKEKSERKKTEIEAERIFPRRERRVAHARARAGAVRRTCAHDSGEIIDAARFNRLHRLVSACLSAKPPAVKPGKGRDEYAGVVGVVVRRPPTSPTFPTTRRSRLVASARSRRVRRRAHRRGAGRRAVEAAPRRAAGNARRRRARARRAAVAALAATTARLEEEFLTLLPESIPYLSELFEDPDEEVEGAARELTATLAELSGKRLKSLMATGG